MLNQSTDDDTKGAWSLFWFGFLSFAISPVLFKYCSPLERHCNWIYFLLNETWTLVLLFEPILFTLFKSHTSLQCAPSCPLFCFGQQFPVCRTLCTRRTTLVSFIGEKLVCDKRAEMLLYYIIYILCSFCQILKLLKRFFVVDNSSYSNPF